MAETGKDINKAKHLLEAGELVAIPTETVYGLAANALNAEAVTRIFQVKNRPRFDPLIVHVSTLDQARLYTKSIPAEAEKLVAAFWPGPLTLLLPRKEIIPDLVTAGLPNVGIRCPDHPLTRELLAAISFPLAAPSANPFGYVSPTTPQHVADQLGDKIRYILDGGACRVGIESTVVSFHNGRGIVHRTGGLSIESLEKVIGKVELQLTSSSDPQAPGQLHSHYAPRKRLVAGDIESLMQQYTDKSVGILSFSHDYGTTHQCVLSPTSNMEEAARNFFACLRALDQAPVDIILAEYAPDTGLGKAINDRLRRAGFGHTARPL